MVRISDDVISDYISSSEDEIPPNLLRLVLMRRFANIKRRKDFDLLSFKYVFDHWYLKDKLQPFMDVFCPGFDLHITGSWYLGHWRHPGVVECADKCELARRIGYPETSDLDFWIDIPENKESRYRAAFKHIGAKLGIKADYVNWTGPGMSLLTGEVRMCNPKNIQLPPRDKVLNKYISIY